ncbi:MAG: serine/threonine-protein kinase [bacterium]|nr:serine/threonine-protein kinase [bacterium]
MTLTPGTRLGPYEIVAPLGAGGMGEVYRAKDTRLGREVAVKVLPQHLTANPEIRARFEREAKTISSLNHPHICTLHDIGREGDTDYLVMELVDGETLAQRLVKGALPVADVLRIGAQIADALDRAHRAGVIHRDLKPGNVMLTKSGAKLMDFGLARATGLTGPPGSASMATMTHSPTMAAPLTAEGTILGTFQYMSPEQLEGVDADARSDLWALGCVLYEMATGKRVFEGRSQATLISAIMTTQPPPVSQNAPLSPPELDRLVSACLAKDPADRVQSAHDVKLQLQWAGEGGSRLGAAAISGSTPARSRRRSLLLALPLLLGVLGLAAIIFSVRELRPKPSAVLSVQVPVPPNLRLTSFWSDNAISPDGRSVIAAGARDTGERHLWLGDLRTAALRDLPETEQGFSPSWSPDSRAFVHFRQNVDGLFRADAGGGPSTRLCDAVWGRGASWGSRGNIVFAPNATGPILSIAAGGGATTQVTELDESLRETAHRFPHFLPDGEHFLYAALPVGTDGFPIYVGSLSSRDRKLVMHSDCAPIYAEPGYLVFVQDGKVTAQRFDLKRLEPVWREVHDRRRAAAIRFHGRAGGHRLTRPAPAVSGNQPSPGAAGVARPRRSVARRRRRSGRSLEPRLAVARRPPGFGGQRPPALAGRSREERRLAPEQRHGLAAGDRLVARRSPAGVRRREPGTFRYHPDERRRERSGRYRAHARCRVPGSGGLGAGREVAPGRGHQPGRQQRRRNQLGPVDGTPRRRRTDALSRHAQLRTLCQDLARRPLGPVRGVRPRAEQHLHRLVPDPGTSGAPGHGYGRQVAVGPGRPRDPLRG